MKRGLFLAALVLFALGCSARPIAVPVAFIPVDENGNLHRAAGPWNFMFDFAEDDTIRPSSVGVKTTAEEIAGYVKTHPGVKIRIDGQEAPFGNEANSFVVNQRRTAAIRAALIDAGVPANRIISAGAQTPYPVK